MASEYSVNISLDTKKAEANLKNLKKGIDGLTSKKGGAAKKELSAEEQLLKIENQQLIVKNKGLGLTLKALPLEQKGIKIKKAEKLIRAANVAASQEDFDLAKKNLLLADKRIKKAQILVRKNQDINKSTAQSLKGGSTGFTAAQYGPQMASTKGAGQVAMNINTILAQSEKRLGFEVKLRNLEAQGVNTAKLRVKMGELVDAQNRKEFGSIDRINRKIRMGIKFEESKLRLVQKANAERAKEAKLLDASVKKIPGFGNFTASQYGPQLPGIFDAPQGAFSRLSDRQSRDREGRRTGLNNMFGGALTRAGATRGFDTQSALISGAFPLLFGQGPVGAAAGALGGGIGGMFGQMGGFAGGIAATAIVQQIQTALKAISDLGQAMGPFTQNTESVTAAIGLQGSAEEARIRLIEQSEGKTAAFNASMQLMANRIGQDGVDSLKEFGDTTRLMNSEFTLAITKIQAFTAGIANFVLRITGLQENLNAAAATRNVADAAARGNAAAQDLVSRRETIERMGSRGGEANRKAVLLAELEAEEKIFAIMQNTTVEADVMTQKFNELLKKITQEEEETARILELRREGLNPEIAKTIAGLEKEAKTSKESLDTQIKLLVDKQKEEGILGELDQKRLTTLEKEKDRIDENIESTRDQIEATYDLNKAATETLDAFESLKTTIQGDIKDGIKGLIKGTSTLGDMVSNVADRFLDLALNQALFGNAGGKTVTGGLFSFLGFANGGRPPVGVPSVVGEKGPELFVPDRSGTIIPNNQLGGSTNIVVNVDASGSSVEGDEEQGRELGKLISVAIQSELVKQKRPGGLLG